MKFGVKMISMKITLIKSLFALLCLGGCIYTAHAHECVMPTDSRYDTHECVFDGLVKISQNGKFGAMDNRGIVIVPLMFDEIGVFDDGTAKVQYRDKFGFINHQGLLVVPLKYDDVGDFQNGRALVRQGDEYFMVDKNGQRVLSDAPVMPPADLTPPKDLTHLFIHDTTIPEPSVN